MEEEKTERSRMMEESSLEQMADRYFGRMHSFLPPEFVGHVRAAQKELLLAARALLDARIESIEARERRRASQRPTRVKID